MEDEEVIRRLLKKLRRYDAHMDWTVGERWFHLYGILYQYRLNTDWLYLREVIIVLMKQLVEYKSIEFTFYNCDHKEIITIHMKEESA
jgi:hypothetical protein